MLKCRAVPLFEIEWWIDSRIPPRYAHIHREGVAVAARAAANQRPRAGDGMEDVGSGGFETKGIGLWIEAFGPERSVPWPAFVEAIEVQFRQARGWCQRIA